MIEDQASWTGWRVIETEHFRVHFPIDLAYLGRLAATLCEQAWDELTPVYQDYPEHRVEVAVVDIGDQPNGYATAMAWPRMVLFTAPPAFDSVLHHYNDWFKLLINHEFTHILQINQIAGVAKWINHIIGHQVIPNQGLPSALLEGGATWAESLTTGRGRVHSAMVQGHLRAQVLDGVLPGVDEWLNEPARWPGVGTWYLHGGVFHDWLMQTYGSHWIKGWHQDFAQGLLNFNLNRSFYKHIGKSLYDLFEDWKSFYTKKTDQWLKKRAPLTQASSWLLGDQRRGHPRVDREGGLWVWQGSQGQNPGIYYYKPYTEKDTQGTRIIPFNTMTHPDLCFNRWGKVEKMIWDQIERVSGRFYQTVLWGAHKLDSTTWSRPYKISDEQRIRYPSCFPEGRWSAVVEVLAGRSRISVLALDGTQTMLNLHDPGMLNQMGRAAVYPFWQTDTSDNDSWIDIVSPMLKDEQAYLVHLRVYADELRSARLDPTQDHLIRSVKMSDLPVHPTFSPDGQWIIYSKPHEYAYDLFKRPWPALTPEIQITRLATGAYSPSLSSSYLVYESLESQGRGVAVLPYPIDQVPPPSNDHQSDMYRFTLNDFSQPLPISPLLKRLNPSLGSSNEKATPPRKSPTSLLKNPSQTSIPMLAPLTWAPAAEGQSSNAEQQVVGLSVSWVDLSESHQLDATLGNVVDTQALQWGLAYRWSRFQPQLSINLAQFERSSEISHITSDTWIDETEMVTTRNRLTRLNIGSQYYILTGQNSLGLSISYEATWSHLIHTSLVETDPFSPPPYFANRDFIGSTNIGLSLSNEYKAPFAIATEYGGYLSLYNRFYHPTLGGDLQRSSVFLTARYHWSIFKTHSIYLYSYNAYARGERGRLLNYQLTRPPDQSVVWSALTAQEGSSNFLRGYPSATLQGSPLGLLTFEHRMPLLSLFRGAQTVPLFLKQIGLAVWSDLGWMVPDDEPWSQVQWKPSAGVELYQAWLAFWRMPIKIRIGIGQGLVSPGDTQYYFMIGRWN